MKIADRDISVADALQYVRAYAAKYPATLEIFDGIGSNSRFVDQSPHEVTLSDIGRIATLNARLSGDDVPNLLSVSAKPLLAEIPIDATLEECEVNGELWAKASELYDLFKRNAGIGPAKRSKLLHAKRPGLYFIHDKRTKKRYTSVADAIAEERAYATQGFWEAARADITQPEFLELMGLVAQVHVEKLEGAPTLGGLSRLRVLDIVAWSL